MIINSILYISKYKYSSWKPIGSEDLYSGDEIKR